VIYVRRFLVSCFVILLVLAGIGWLAFHLIASYRSYDWPLWRYDANRSAESPQRLPRKLYLQWVREYPKLEQAWENPLNQDLMQFDKVYEPVAYGKTLFIGSSASDRLVALDTETGEEKWAFYVDGPVRFPPVASKGVAYFVSDDGYLYCVDAEKGNLVWKFRGGPSDRKILGNGRLISTWPARGGPVLKDGIIYFGAGIWPFMGVFIYALDAETGEVVWENDSTGPIYMKQPHNSPSYAGVAPQGTFVIAGDKLLVPCGRSVPACFDRKTGELLYYHLSKYNKTGGAFVSALGDFFINYHRNYVTSIYDLSEGDIVVSRFGNIPVMTKDALFSMGRSIKAFDLKNLEQVDRAYRVIVDEKDQKVETVRDKRRSLKTLWELGVDASGDLIKSGKRLYAGGRNVVSAIDISSRKPKVSWRAEIDGTASRIIAAGKKLFVVTLEGRIYAFGGKDVQPTFYTYTQGKSVIAKELLAKAEYNLKAIGVEDGYCLAYGLENGDLIEALARKSELRIIASDPDPAKVDGLRRRFDALGLYGKRIHVLVGDPYNLETPPYLASLTVFENLKSAGYLKEGEDDNSSENPDPEFFEKIYHSMRPYGGVACLPVGGDEASRVMQQIQASKLPNAKIIELENAADLPQADKYLLLIREGPLPGAGEWTHQYGDIANTLKSDDQLVKLPLGILWFGGSSNMDVLPRHGHGPPEQVIGGRLFIEGIDLFSARDVYTGRVLWKRHISDLNNYGIYYDETYANTPLDPAYNQIHIPGANARGTNFAATLDKIYIAKKDSCLVLDPATGKTMDEIKLPTDPKTGLAPDWGYIGVYKDYLIAGAGFVSYLDFVEFDEIADPEMSSKRRPFYNYDITSSKRLIVMNRHTGKILWNRNSELGFRHNAIAVGNNRIFCIDTLPDPVSDALKRRLGDHNPGTPRLMALDVRSGRVIWSTSRNVFGTWLSYSEEHDVLLQSGRHSRDMLHGEPNKGIATCTGKDGKSLWSIDASPGEPLILHGDTIITNRYAYGLLTGEKKMRIDPSTGEERPWVFRRNYGCNYAIASEHLLTFRSAAAGFFDLMRDGGTGNFGGFKTGCTSNLVVADGVLNAPEYTRTCSCSYQNQTSLALVYMPDVEMWTDYFDEPSNSAVESSPVAIVFSDLDGELIYVNKSFLGMFGYSKKAEVLGKSAVELLSMEDKASELVEALTTKGEWTGKLVAAGKDGLRLDIYLSARMIADEAGNPVSTMASFVDIASSAIASFDLSGTITYANNSFLDLTGYDDDKDVLGKPASEFWKSSLIRELRYKGRWTGETVVVKNDGSTLDINLSGNVAKDKTGDPVSVMVSFIDITELKKIEESMLKSGGIRDYISPGNPVKTLAINLGAPGDRRADNGMLWLEYPIVGGPSVGIQVSIVPEDCRRFSHHSSRIQGDGLKWVMASGIEGVSSVTVTLAAKPDETDPQEEEQPAQVRPYTVRLYFAEPDETMPGERVFDVAIQGRKVLDGLDIVAEAGGSNRPVVKEFSRIMVGYDLIVDFAQRKKGKAPLICGIEVVAEGW
jgi:PAS domain S-box-containing protein